ncbi:MAG: CPBP family intramembrane metalloprotease [Lachnospiraceae bacterium]|nr:CPBP family intramembrane metalloprotease [Lachnospiraceae bacterium]
MNTHFGFFTTGFSLTGEAAIHTGIGYILMCVFFNIVNVIMEEGTFRGLFHKIIETDHSFRFAVLFQAILFGIWHIVTPLHNLIDGNINVATFFVLGVGYTILAGLMGVKWALLYRMTGNLYAGMADHFFNNCIATNLLHVITDTGTDEMMIFRVIIAQLLSFALVMTIWLKRSGSAGNLKYKMTTKR